MILEGQEDPACILYTLPAAGLPGVGVQASLALRGPDGQLPPAPVPGWERREIPIERLAAADELVAVDRSEDPEQRFVFVLHPERELLAGGEDPFTFEHRFSQQVDAFSMSAR